MTSAEFSIDKPEILILKDKVQVIESFIQSQLEGKNPYEDKEWGEGVMMRESPLLQLGNGSTVWCRSKTGGETEEPDFVKISVYGVDDSSHTLYLNSGDTFDFSLTNSDGDEVYDYEGKAWEEASTNANFITTVDVVYKLITEEVPKPKREFPRIPLPVSVILVEGGAMENISRPTLEIGFAEKPFSEKGQDAILADESQNLFGVFDGVGGREGSEIAARLAAKTTQMLVTEAQPKSPHETEEILINALTESHLVIAGWNESSAAGSTTATVAQILEHDGEDFLAWASVGDTRIYLKAEDTITQISKDEGEGRSIHNALGRNGFFTGVKQHGIVRLPHDYEIMLCTDGITGDQGAEILDSSEIAQVLNESLTAQAAAQKLVDVSRKKDDKAVIVIRSKNLA